MPFGRVVEPPLDGAPPAGVTDAEVDALGGGVVTVGLGTVFSADLATQSSQAMFQSVQPLPGSIARGLPVYSTGSPFFIWPNNHSAFAVLMPVQPWLTLARP